MYLCPFLLALLSLRGVPMATSFTTPLTKMTWRRYPHRQNQQQQEQHLPLSSSPRVITLQISSSKTNEEYGPLSNTKSSDIVSSANTLITRRKSIASILSTSLLPITLSSITTHPTAAIANEDTTKFSSNDTIELPDGKGSLTTFQITQLLTTILPPTSISRPPTLHKNAISKTSLLTALSNHFQWDSPNSLTLLDTCLQRQLIHPIPNTDDLYRLQPYHEPSILNSYLPYNPSLLSPQELDPFSLLTSIRDDLTAILSRYTSEDNLVDYLGASSDPDFPSLERKIYTISRIDLSSPLLSPPENKRAFGINLYNLMIRIAFVKVGVPATLLSRGSFFGSVSFRVGGRAFSFNEWENGVLRGNKVPPFSLSRPFPEGDERRTVALDKVDPRIHFALNCGAKSCPPVRWYTVEDLEGELGRAAADFCGDGGNVDVKEGEVKLSKIFSWYEGDFVEGGDGASLSEGVLRFLTGTKRETLQQGLLKGKTVAVSFFDYDWTTDAGRSLVYDGSQLKSDEFSIKSLFS